MSQRRTTVPATRKHSRSPASGQKGLIAKEKTKKQSARRRTVLDDRFHRTYHSVQLRAAITTQRQSGTPAATDFRTTRSVAAVTPCKLEMQQALQRRGYERPLVSCYAELDGADSDGPSTPNQTCTNMSPRSTCSRFRGSTSTSG
jgi:hypothetical protein